MNGREGAELSKRRRRDAEDAPDDAAVATKRRRRRRSTSGRSPPPPPKGVEGASRYFVRRYPEVFAQLTRELRSRRSTRRRSLERMLFGKMSEERGRRPADPAAAVFSCPACGGLLGGRPVTLGCGHTFCEGCCAWSCAVCGAADEPSAGCATRRRVNVLVLELVNKWKERNGEGDGGLTVPCAEDLLGVKPRYHLRSGYAGLQIDRDVEEKLKRYLRSPHRHRKRMLKTRNAANENNRNRLNERSDGDLQDALRDVFRDVDDIKNSVLRSSWDCVSASDLECVLCGCCFLDPVTTSCGHTFCRDCLTRVLDHRLSCPLCMSPLSVLDYSRGTTEVVERAIRLLAPDELEKRISNSKKECMMLGKSLDIPVFVCTNAFPGVACPLYVYEPRYRLLTRRCLQSSAKTFAMAGGKEEGRIEPPKFVQCGTILEVRDAVSLEDGRFILSTVGVRRYRVISRDEQDGYDTARIQYIRDSEVRRDELDELVDLHDMVLTKAKRWISSLFPKIYAEVERLIGAMPQVEEDWPSLPDGPKWAWWLMPILPLSSQLQVGFLSTTSLEKRLKAIDKMLEHMLKMGAVETNTVAALKEAEETSESCSNEAAYGDR